MRRNYGGPYGKAKGKGKGTETTDAEGKRTVTETSHAEGKGKVQGEIYAEGMGHAAAGSLQGIDAEGHAEMTDDEK